MNINEDSCCLDAFFTQDPGPGPAWRNAQPVHPASPAWQFHGMGWGSALQCVKKQQKGNFLPGLQKIKHKVSKNVRKSKLSYLIPWKNYSTSSSYSLIVIDGNLTGEWSQCKAKPMSVLDQVTSSFFSVSSFPFAFFLCCQATNCLLFISYFIFIQERNISPLKQIKARITISERSATHQCVNWICLQSHNANTSRARKGRGIIIIRGNACVWAGIDSGKAEAKCSLRFKSSLKEPAVLGKFVIFLKANGSMRA